MDPLIFHSANNLRFSIFVPLNDEDRLMMMDQLQLGVKLVITLDGIVMDSSSSKPSLLGYRGFLNMILADEWV